MVAGKAVGKLFSRLVLVWWPDSPWATHFIRPFSEKGRLFPGGSHGWGGTGLDVSQNPCWFSVS